MIWGSSVSGLSRSFCFQVNPQAYDSYSTELYRLMLFERLTADEADDSRISRPMISRHHAPPNLNPLREMFAPKSLRWMNRKDTWFLGVALAFGLVLSVALGCLLFLINR